MIFSLYFSLKGIYGPGGHAHESIDEILGIAVPLAETALDQMDDLVNELEWFDTSGTEGNPRQLLQSDDSDEVQGILSQISDTMKSRGFGWLDIQSHDDLFSLVAHHAALDWTSDDYKKRYAELRRSYLALISELSDEWSAA